MQPIRNLIRSGQWFFSGQGADIFYNPKPIESAEAHREPLCKGARDASVDLTDSDLISYAAKLAEAGNQLKRWNPDLVLVPLRGGLRPYEHLRVYCDIEGRAIWFPFTGKEKLSEETQHMLTKAVLPFMGKAHLRIAVIDTADGGYGSFILKAILEDLHIADPKSHWELTYYLFVPKRKEWADWKFRLERQSTKFFTLKVRFFAVPTVIGEDVDAAFATSENYKNYQRLTLESGGCLFQIETYELPRLLDEEIAKATHFVLSCDPLCRVIDISRMEIRDEKAI